MAMTSLFAEASFTEIFPLLKQYGPLILVVVFLLWQGWQRETRMCNRIDLLEDEQRNVLLPMVERCTEVITQNTNVMERLEKSLDDRLTCPFHNGPQGCTKQ
jgi:hypothetical protein